MSTKPTISFNALSILFNMREIKEFFFADDRFLGWAFSNKNKNKFGYPELRDENTPQDTPNVVLYIEYTLNIFREKFDISEEEIINIKKYLEDTIGLEDYYAEVEDELEDPQGAEDDEIESDNISDLKNKYMDFYGEI